MSSTDRVRVLDAKLELTRHLTTEERTEVGGITLPVVNVDRGPFELGALLDNHRAFAATLLDGMLVHAVRVGEQTAIQLLGPGDLLLQSGHASPSWLEDFAFRAAAPARLALLGNEFLAVAGRWPQIGQALLEGAGDQMRRLTGQLVICQLPRVDQRVLAVMWLLAETWGQVTPGGIRLPLALTHETLGALVGARRPTVTLALRKLSDQGSIVHQDSGWLLLDAPPEPGSTGVAAKLLPPELAGISRWEAARAPEPDPSVAFAELSEAVRRLREQHTYDQQQTREQLKRISTARARVAVTRERIARDVVSRRLRPSS